MLYIRTLIASLSLLILSGCVREIKTEYVFIEPSTVLLQDCEVYGMQDKRIRSALEQSIKNKGSLEKCNEDKRSIRKEIQEQKNIYNK